MMTLAAATSTLPTTIMQGALLTYFLRNSSSENRLLCPACDITSTVITRETNDDNELF